jgi:hypothetical protein
MHGREASQGTPRWVKMTGIVMIALLLLFASLHLIGRRFLGPSFGGHGDDAVDSRGAHHGWHQL